MSSTRVAQATTASSSSRRGYNATAGSSSRHGGQGPRREAVHYTVERVRQDDGREQDVLTIEDTPEPPAGGAAAPVAGPSNGAAYPSTSNARHDPYSGYQPPPKKRKSDVGTGAYAAPQYAAPANYSGYSQAGPSQQQYRAPVASGTKRKADDQERNNVRPSFHFFPSVRTDFVRLQRPVQKPKEQTGSLYSDADGHFIVNVGAIVTDRTFNRTCSSLFTLHRSP
jgi:hypothetical protein